MTLETDSGHWTITNATQWDWVAFNEEFSTIPDAVIFGVADKTKTAIDLDTIVEIGASASGETTDARFLAKETGYDAGSASTHPEMDSFTFSPTLEKTNEAVSFNDTFTSAPIVITGYEGDVADWKGGKTSAANITTTGCDVATEFKGATDDVVNIFVIYTNGFWEV
jgi:hypothetical protein